ncbi:hypothetical protein CC80DRAFT_544688 [Byssothecium circinans]|uniref:C2H2-type domain-containing protein n=1 Tax=Byssothecium circinans TaxID=147558 RepID=A0A6A5U8D5_9PLEO|nr:hypothetical protein CC80DRAFT_544688 [Byssothecium circinans]
MRMKTHGKGRDISSRVCLYEDPETVFYYSGIAEAHNIKKQTVLDDPPAATWEDASAQVPKLGKAAQKRAKRAAKQADAQSEDGGLNNKCLGCDVAFPSKSRLHQHLQDNPKHAALKSVAGAKGKKKGKR